MLFVLYSVSYLDRINISFSPLTMNDALVITTAQSGLVVGIFIPATFSSKYPCDLLLQKMVARVWIARILMKWGIVAALTGAVQHLAQFLWLQVFARRASLSSRGLNVVRAHTRLSADAFYFCTSTSTSGSRPLRPANLLVFEETRRW